MEPDPMFVDPGGLRALLDQLTQTAEEIRALRLPALDPAAMSGSTTGDVVENTANVYLEARRGEIADALDRWCEAAHDSAVALRDADAAGVPPLVR